MTRELWVMRLGRVAYADALRLQREIARARIAGKVPHDVLLLVEHPAVVTLGRTAKAHHLVADPAALRTQGIEVFDVERGGDVTFHGPGQLVGYPIVDLKRHTRDLHWYLRSVEEGLIRALADFGIVGWRHAGYTGVWVGARAAGAERPRQPSPVPRKIASIGVHARDWVTWHGFALNVTTDLDYFSLIVPCGIPGVVMTSMARELGSAVRMSAVEEATTAAYAEVFSLTPVAMDPSVLHPAQRSG